MTAIEFLLRCAGNGFRIVSTGDLIELQISEARADGRMFVDEASGLGFVLLPWDLTTDKDRKRERDFFARIQMLGGE